MLGKNKITFINSLKINKFRNEHQMFLVEGVKMVTEILNSDFKVLTVYSTADGMKYLEGRRDFIEIMEVSDDELKKISSFSTPNKLIAIARIPEVSFSINELSGKLTLALEDIQDPGNMGTIIRIADWFGITLILCSENCVDIYNPKVLQATMGAISRVKIKYMELYEFLKDSKKENFPSIYGTFLEGENIYTHSLTNTGIILLGNESKGISKKLEEIVDTKLYIPDFSKNEQKSESLNVSIATAIVCSEFRRRIFF